MDAKFKRQRQMVNAATIQRCRNLGFLGTFLNMTGGRREDLLEQLGISGQAFCRWFKVDDIRWSTVVKIYDLMGYSARMVFSYPKGKAPSRSAATAVLNMLDPSSKLAPLFVEMKLNNQTFDTIGKAIGRTSQAVNHWFLEDEIAVSMIYKMAEAMGASVEFVPEKKEA